MLTNHSFTNRQREIIESAIMLIAEKGIQGCTTKNIAMDVGISEAALYRHFTNKQAIFQGIIDSFARLDSPCLEDTGGSIEKITAFLHDRFARFAANPALAKVMLSEAVFQHDPQISQSMIRTMHKHRELLGAVIEDGQRAGEIRDDIETKELFRVIAGAMRITVVQWQLTNCAFDLTGEGKKITAALISMLEKP